MKYTPEPWIVVQESPFLAIRAKDGGGNIAVVTCRTEAKANAQLIATAPRLLEALKDLVGCLRRGELGDISPVMDEIFDAEHFIKEAEVDL